MPARVALFGITIDNVTAAEAVEAVRRLLEEWKGPGARYPGLRIAGTYSPPFGFERDAAECRRIAERINRARPDILAVGLGCPKQELWTAAHRRSLEFGVALCIGAAIDFAAGNLARAPQWMQDNGLEWLYRLAQEPGRLWKRYLVDDMAFARVVAREWLNRRNA